jgi:hypothetical protein
MVSLRIWKKDMDLEVQMSVTCKTQISIQPLVDVHSSNPCPISTSQTSVPLDPCPFFKFSMRLVRGYKLAILYSTAKVAKVYSTRTKVGLQYIIYMMDSDQQAYSNRHRPYIWEFGKDADLSIPLNRSDLRKWRQRMPIWVCLLIRVHHIYYIL